jgi:fructose-1,6-bisphosphatase II
MKNIPSFYVDKLAYGPQIAREIRRNELAPISLNNPFEKTLIVAAIALKKRISDLVVVILDRPRNQKYVDIVRREGASLRLIADGDIAAAVAPSLPDSGVDLYIGIGGAPEGILTAAALKALDGEIQMRMWPRDEEERADLLKVTTEEEINKTFFTNELVAGGSSIFCATGISDSALLPGVKLVGNTAITHSILMRARSKTVRYIRAVHNLAEKTIHVRSSQEDLKL